MYKYTSNKRNRGSSNTESDSKAWCSLCKTSVPSKIRVFLWRLAQQSLPTAYVLEHQNIRVFLWSFEAFAIAADLGLPRFYVASDCKQVVDDIKEGSLGKYGSVIQEITARRNQFAECTIEFEGRSNNSKLTT
jgi:hypothetical protein